MQCRELIREASREPLSEDELEHLGESLRTLFSQGGPLVRLLGRIETEIEGARLSMQNSDLVTEEGRLGAIRTQGRIQGLARALELITEPVEEVNAKRTAGQ